MIGVLDSGHGGLTVLRALADRFPSQSFVYLGDHANAPYGNRPSDEVVTLARECAEALFALGAGLVLLACNTATCVAVRVLQQDWLPQSRWRGRHNILGIVAPTVEAATQTPWGVTTPQYPQRYNNDLIAVLGTRRTVASGVYPDEIVKRCPLIRIVQQACPDLAGAIEASAPEAELDALVERGVSGILAQTGGAAPHRAILGCTHYPIVEHLFRRHLPPATRILSQPEAVAHSLEDYLARHPRFRGATPEGAALRLLTTGDPASVSIAARRFWPESPPFEAMPATA